MKYEWILFDADETLFHFDAFAGLKTMFSAFSIDFTESDYKTYQAVNLPLWVEYQNGTISALELQERRFSGWAERLSVSAKHLNDQFINAMADICSLLPGTQLLTDALLGKVKMGIITNGFTGLQTIRLERTGMSEYFNLLVISEQVGIAKPDIQIFDYAFEKMNFPDKSKVLMVGDNLQSDIQGGINAGIDTCWLNRDGKVNNTNIMPTFEVSCLSLLASLVIE